MARHAAADRAAQSGRSRTTSAAEVQAEEQRQLKVAHRRRGSPSPAGSMRTAASTGTRLREEDRRGEDFDRRQADASELTRAAASEAAALDPFLVLGWREAPAEADPHGIRNRQVDLRSRGAVRTSRSIDAQERYWRAKLRRGGTRRTKCSPATSMRAAAPSATTNSNACEPVNSVTW